MKKTLRPRAVRALSLIVFFYPLSAHAYVDPSSSLLILQGILAALGVALVFVRNPIKAIKKLIAKIRGKEGA
jgi:hypothetical protein